MNVTFKEVKVYRVEAFCNCGGRMTPNGAFAGKEMEYTCKRCGAREMTSERFPRTEYRELVHAVEPPMSEVVDSSILRLP